VRAYRVVLSARMLGRLYHAEGVERKIRNSVLGARSANEFYDGLQWLYRGTGLAA
jgi:salicylate hydroxylase